MRITIDVDNYSVKVLKEASERILRRALTEDELRQVLEEEVKFQYEFQISDCHLYTEADHLPLVFENLGIK